MNLEMVTVFIVVFGLMIGSFLNVCIYRIPKKESIVIPRSHCPHCNHQLRVWENIPVISFLMLKGLCSSCKNKISFRYPIIELLTAILLLMAYFRFGLSVDFFIYSFFLCLLVIITFIDIDTMEILNGLLILGLIVGVYPVLEGGINSIYQSLIGALSLGLGFFLIRVIGQLLLKKESMGFGDVKYAALIGLLLGWKIGLVASAIAFLSAAILFLMLLPFRKIAIGQRIPFGPFLSFGALLGLIWGPHILEWYLNLVF
ncbi:prepilin peptidase [bacterium]|nr:prepilin peptidase [bacterium]MBU1064884.1 prepilin peptidase [bacterium]MBU1634925.1 prepilin peptidase [bacterium]MBU1872600.1 prepilin peptidase [bacterium]